MQVGCAGTAAGAGRKELEGLSSEGPVWRAGQGAAAGREPRPSRRPSRQWEEEVRKGWGWSKRVPFRMRKEERPEFRFGSWL